MIPHHQELLNFSLGVLCVSAVNLEQLCGELGAAIVRVM